MYAIEGFRSTSDDTGVYVLEFGAPTAQLDVMVCAAGIVDDVGMCWWMG